MNSKIAVAAETRGKHEESDALHRKPEDCGTPETNGQRRKALGA
jgi:hypothetical protein